MLPLQGITVIALEQAVAVPFATRQLADLGARVIKIERPEVGDFARAYDKTVNGESSHFVWLNRSKESLTLDVKHEEAGNIFHKLLSGADVFIQNLAPGATLPTHAHDNEQFTLVAEGDVHAYVAGNSHRVKDRFVIHVPPGTSHGIIAGSKGARIVTVQDTRFEFAG